MKRIALVTGASSGIGQAVSEMLAQNGYIVYGASRSGKGRSQDSLHFVRMDVRDEEMVLDVMREIESKHGALHVLVNCAGLGMLGAIEDCTSSEVEDLFQTNLMGVHHVCKHSLSLLRKGGESYIINITSVAAQMGLPYRGIYCASKFAVEGYTESLSQEVARDGVRVVIVEPGDVFTSINGNRKVVGQISERHSSIHHAIQKQVNGEVEGGLNPVEIAAGILSILKTKKPRLRYRMARPQAKLAYYLMRLLPDRLFERIVMRHYKV
jgi:NAD(P)-dependent dehydrogenase (short-subunit alcohol dehydrogenase family)